jgi:pyruvate dehydrogenase E2 component (dihydrolipoamide acetyltransferase)
MAEEILMPPMGQTTKNLKILSWHKKEGEPVEQGEVLLEVETDKATVEVESYASGTVLKTLFQEGDVVEVGTLIAYVGNPGEDVEAPASPAAQPAPEGISKAQPVPERGAEAGAPVLPAGKVLASPVARKLAKDNGIDLGALRGTGPGGRIKKQDVLAAIQQKGAAAPAAAAAAHAAVAVPAAPTAVGVPGGAPPMEGLPAEGKIIEASRLRRAVAERLMHSFQSIPHIYLTARFDMSQAAKYLKSTKDNLGIKLTFTHLILWAAAKALRREPAVNRLWLEDGKIKLLGKSSVGLAVAGEESLIVVTVPEPDKMNLTQLAEYTGGAVSRARSGRLSGEDLAECSLTVSNLGMYGVDEFSAIIDPQQTAILAIGKIGEEPVIRGGGLFSCPKMSVTLSADHRVVDGVNAARYLAAFREILENFG